MEKFDVVVVGAGITGLSSAYHIKRENPDMRVALLERKSTFAQGNTGRSAAGFRDVFSSEMNRKLASSSISFYRHVQEDLHHDIGMKFTGYLFLLGSGALDSGYTREAAAKSRSRFVDKHEIEEMGFRLRPERSEAELMGLSDIEGGLLGLNCGIIEPDKLCGFYDRQIREMGVEAMYGTEVKRVALEPVKPLNYPGEPFLWQEKTVRSLQTSSGEVSADTYVLCTDVWTTALLDPTGIDSHIRPKKRQVFQVSGPEIGRFVEHPMVEGADTVPFVVLPSHRVYMRPEPRSRSLWISVADEYGRDFSFTEDPQPEPEFYEKSVFPVARSYLPILSSARVTSMWAGHYAYNTIDRTHYIFRDLNVIVATGTSGSGIMKGDAAGRIVSALLGGKEFAELYNGERVRVSDLGVEERRVPREHMVI